MACAGDVPTLETLAAVDLLRNLSPGLKIRVINVVDLMTLQPHEAHPHGLTDLDFDALFTTDKPVIFAHHGYPWLIHRLTYRRRNHDNIHVRGYKEEGTTTTPGALGSARSRRHHDPRGGGWESGTVVALTEIKAHQSAMLDASSIPPVSEGGSRCCPRRGTGAASATFPRGSLPATHEIRP